MRLNKLLNPMKVTQSCPTLCDPRNYTVHRILQAKILEWVAVPFSSRSSQPRDWTQVSCIAGRFFTSWATREFPKHWRIDAFVLWCWRRLLRAPLDCKEIKPVYPKGNQPWTFIGRTDAKAEIPILWPPDAKSWLIGKYPVAGKDWRQEERGTLEEEMDGWHHQLSGH